MCVGGVSYLLAARSMQSDVVCKQNMLIWKAVTWVYFSLNGMKNINNNSHTFLYNYYLLAPLIPQLYIILDSTTVYI